MFGICQPNPSCRSSLRRNCCAVLLTASERYEQSSATSVHAATTNGTGSGGSTLMNAPVRKPRPFAPRLAPHHRFAQSSSAFARAYGEIALFVPESVPDMCVCYAPMRASSRLCIQSNWNCEPKIFCHSVDASNPLSAYSYSHAFSARLYAFRHFVAQQSPRSMRSVLSHRADRKIHRSLLPRPEYRFSVFSKSKGSATTKLRSPAWF